MDTEDGTIFIKVRCLGVFIAGHPQNQAIFAIVTVAAITWLDISY
jgi:hypothetical protein